MIARAFTLKTADDLSEAGLVPREDIEIVHRVAARYAIAVTPSLAKLIDRSSQNDPIAKQFVPSSQELSSQPQELRDPIGDEAHSPVPGIVHRYQDRVLFKIASVCPVYCRFCFRREMVGPESGQSLSAKDIATALTYIRQHSEIWEVILTGGDPLILSNRRIEDVTRALGQIDHVKILRWHTRVPVADPARITPDLIAALKSSSKAVVVGLHTNHARELTEAARVAIARLTHAGIQLVSQTVLLKGINDDADTLEALLRTLVACGVKPYYLHHGDLAPGTSHFRTTIRHGKALMEELRRRVSGLALPSYMLDIPGGAGKVDIMSNVEEAGPGLYRVTGPDGTLHTYRDCCTAGET